MEICVPSNDHDEVKKVFEAKSKNICSFIFDFEDTVIPSAQNLIEGYKNVFEVISNVDSDKLSNLPNLMARVRNLHLKDTILSEKDNARLIGCITDVAYLVSSFGKNAGVWTKPQFLYSEN